MMTLPPLFEVSNDDVDEATKCGRCYDCSGEEYEDDEEEDPTQWNVMSRSRSSRSRG